MPASSLRWCVLPLSLALLSPLWAAGDITTADEVGALPAEIRTYLSTQVAKGGGIYVSQLVRGDINADGKPDAYVSYSVENGEGGNFTLLHEALFIAENGRLVFKAARDNGSTGTASGVSFSAEGIEQGRILGQNLAYAEGDGACCPSLKSAAVIRYENGKLVQAER